MASESIKRKFRNRYKCWKNLNNAIKEMIEE